MATVTVYTGPACPQCNATKRALGKAGIEFNEIEITDELRARFRAAGFRSMPVVTTPDVSWSGFRPDMIERLVP